MLVTTLFVVACPATFVLALGASGAVTSTIGLSLISLALSLVVSFAGAAIWKRRRDSGDLVFGDLMIWGWLRRWRFGRLLTHTAALIGPASSVAASERELSRISRARLLERLSRTLEARDPHTHGHSRRVARYAAGIAKRMALPAEEVARIRTAAILHDVGKIDTPKEILDKRGPLSKEEYEVVKKHAPVGAGMVADLGDSELTAIVRSHHERLDGGGYPDGLAGEEIPLGARVIAVADTFDAVTSARPYRRALAHREALALLAEEAGTQLDPAVVRGFRRYYSGHRLVAFWAALLALPRQAGFLLFDLPRFGSALTGAKVAAASLVTAAVGTAVVLPPAQPDRAAPAAADESRQQLVGGGARGSTDPATSTRRGSGREQGGPVSVEVSGPGGARGLLPAPAPAAQPLPTASQPSGTGRGGSSGGEEATSTAPSSARSGSSSGSQATTTPAPAPVETPATPSAAPVVSSTVEQTVQGVGSTVNQALTPTVESVNGILEQTTGGLLGGGR